LAPATCYTERELLKLSNAELRSILKKLKITGWLQADTSSMARQIVFRTEQRAKFQKLSALYNIKAEPPPVSGGEAQGKLSNEN
jgi:hypothetical protein